MSPTDSKGIDSASGLNRNTNLFIEPTDENNDNQVDSESVPGPENENQSDEEESDEEDSDDTETEDEDELSGESENENESAECSSVDPIKEPLSPNSQPTCYICLNEFEGQDVGSPDSCENIHHFCLECIEEWSKQVNTCPVDRKTFTYILVKRELNGEITMKLPVTKNSVVEIEMMDDDVTYCEICGRCDREDRLLLCDGCDFGYHCECLDPPLETVPVDDWFCPECFDRRQQANIPQTSSRRAIARTGAFEIVRNRILARRTTQEPRTRTSNSNPPRRKARRKRRKTRKTRKTTKSSTKKGKKTKTRRRRKRTRKSKLSYKRLPSASVRSRIASKLGITRKPKSPFGLPAMKLSSTTISEIRSAAGIGSLSIFGNELDFNNPRSYDDEFEFESSFGGVGLIARARNNLSGPVGKSIKSPFSTSCMNSADLLSEIMNSQEILHATSCDLSVARDGRIYLKSDGKNGFQKCADSNSSSSSSPSSSNDNNGSADNSNNNNGYLKQTFYSEQASSNSPESDISLIKPSPVVALLDEKADFELYSDIESVGDNREETEDAADKKISVKCKDKVICDKDEKHDNISGENIEAAETPIDSSNNHKSNDSIDSKAKRRPSIRDLFGGDSDEEVDDDLKQLVAQQGSINIHYPIKMPIVLKTNFINDKFQSEGGNEVPISKKWIPIYPEAEKCKNTGPKWKAVGQSNLDKANNDSKTNNQKQIEQINKTKEKNDNLKFETIKNDNVNSLNATKKPEIQIEKKDYFRSVEESQRSKEIIDIVTHENAKVKKCIEDSEKKIRVCKHGRLIKKDKPKEIIKETMKETRKRSQSFDREQNKKSNANPNILNEDKDKHLKKLKLSQTDDNDANLNWKKLSSSSKMRNYRDGKYKDVDLLYKDRLLKSDPRPSKDKKSSHRDGEKRKVRTEKMDRDHHSRRKFEDESRNRRKSSSKKSKHKSSSKIESEPKTKDNKISNRRASTEKEIKSSKGTKHHNHHHHHHSKHKHSEEDHHHKHHRHHNPSKSSQVDKLSGKIDLVDNSKKESLLAKSSNYETYPVLKTLDSKQIYSEGDKIIINVNFKRDKTPNEDDRINLKRDIKEFNLSQNKDSFNNSHHDSSDNNVDILSPQSIENYAFQSDNSISSPFSIEEFADTNRSTVNKISENFKKVLSEEFNFLPRILSTKETSNSNDLGPTTPDQYLDDSFLPTPTQDESHSPIINTTSNAIISRLNKKPSKSDSILSTSPLETNDFYDPELPLQSPDRDSIKSPSKDKDKIIYDSVASPKESPIAKRDNSLSHGNSSAASTSLSSTVAAATATLASLNSINLAQLIQIAQTLKMKTNSSSTNKNSQNNQSQSLHMDNSNRDIMEIVDMDVDSPTPCSSPVNNTRPNNNGPSSLNNVKDIWDQIVKTASARLNNNGSSNANQQAIDSKKAKFDHLLEEPPTSAVDMEIKDKYIKKLNRLERVVEEVKVSLKPHYQKKKISKDEYKEILRKAVPKICHNKSGEINPLKISKLVEGYIKKYRYLRKKTKN